ncbi:retrotransposon [Scheffersomyces stipitis CBS 6054]|uniref:Retrotransposon n=1 Tax=Scheffersomyces stipitis (strain ATCC 58785 / CBS 6054 / NBRC 10063 / NRRL Y-11545) TaxID=322104 RepID=A3LYU8_PICST|nr:retrotransposon [Scheffersomyces stipitis CBS 6054]ABN68042.2 retrotransposon [Scheffersomyces stipitis CBS 6054]
MNNPIQSTELPKQTVQQVMSQLNSGLMVIDTLLLRGRENFSEWKDWMTGMFSSCVLATEIAAYLSEKELSITFTDQQALSHKLRELILKCMKPDVQSLFTHYSSGVETWKAVETKYAIASSRDAVGYLKYLFGRLADPTITTEAGFLIAEKLTAFMTKYDNDSMKALLFLYGTGNSKDLQPF